MEFFELIERRYSVRAYRADEIPEALLARVLEAARLAPTAANRQPFQIIVLKTAGREADLGRVYHRAWFASAPLVLCVCGLGERAWVRRDGRSYLDADLAIVMDHMVLAAADLGLGTCWIANFDAEAARSILGLPAEVEPFVFTPLGYPADKPSVKERLPLKDLVRYERW